MGRRYPRHRPCRPSTARRRRANIFQSGSLHRFQRLLRCMTCSAFACPGRSGRVRSWRSPTCPCIYQEGTRRNPSQTPCSGTCLSSTVRWDAPHNSSCPQPHPTSSTGHIFPRDRPDTSGMLHPRARCSCPASTRRMHLVPTLRTAAQAPASPHTRGTPRSWPSLMWSCICREDTRHNPSEALCPGTCRDKRGSRDVRDNARYPPPYPGNSMGRTCRARSRRTSGMCSRRLG